MSGEEETMIEEETLNPNQPQRRPIISSEQLDIESYISLYTGRTKISRLIFISDHCNNNVGMQVEALRMAYDLIKKGENTQLFKEVCNKIDGRLGKEYTMDSSWIESVEKRAEQRKEKLENELNAYRALRMAYDLIKKGESIQLFKEVCNKIDGILVDAHRTNLIKESIRMGYNDFGDFFYAHGALGDAFKNYVRTRDYCTTSKHIIHMCFSAILVSIEMGQFTHVSSYVNKAEQSPDALDPVTVAKLRAAAGLSLLESKKYKLAARKFLETGNELGNNYNEVIAPQDIATYGGLCALASFDRSELKSKVIDNVSFRNFLELVPEVRELINDFYSSHYASCLDYLGNLKANLLLDIHLHDHVLKLYNDIRHKALIQYTLPFVSVDLRMMANAFKTDVAGLEKELEALITENQIQARIDSHNKILYARHADQRNATFQRVLQTGGEFDKDVRSMLLRANLLKLNHSSRSMKKF